MVIDILKRNNIRQIGEGETAMIFAHGFGCDQNVWRHLTATFQSKYRLILFDYVGAGKSDLNAYDPERYNSLDGYAQDVIEIIDYLDIKKAIFVGHSVSSMVGVRAALLKPQMFEKLIFVTPSPCYINDRDYIGGMELADLEALFVMMDNNYLGWSSAIAPLIMGTPDRPELGEELTANFCATDPDIAREFARVTFFSDNRTDLNKLTIPSLTLQCSNDMLAPLAVGQYINKHAPDNTLVVLDACGHCPHLSAPKEITEAIATYLN